MGKYYYEYEKSVVVEDEVEIPDKVIAKGDKAIRAFIIETVLNDDYSPDCASEYETVDFKAAEVPA